MEFIWIYSTTFLDDNIQVNYVMEDEIDYNYLADVIMERAFDDINYFKN